MTLPQKPTPRVFSGMQPTGNLHLGNYLGAMVRWVEMQKSHECIYCVVDMHAITMWQDPKELKGADPLGHGRLHGRGARSEARASSSTRARCTSTPSSPGCSTAWRGSAGSTA